MRIQLPSDEYFFFGATFDGENGTDPTSRKIEKMSMETGEFFGPSSLRRELSLFT